MFLSVYDAGIPYHYLMIMVYLWIDVLYSVLSVLLAFNVEFKPLLGVQWEVQVIQRNATICDELQKDDLSV